LERNVQDKDKDEWREWTADKFEFAGRKRFEDPKHSHQGDGYFEDGDGR
jgi:hypothetical protein